MCGIVGVVEKRTPSSEGGTLAGVADLADRLATSVGQGEDPAALLPITAELEDLSLRTVNPKVLREICAPEGEAELEALKGILERLLTDLGSRAQGAAVNVAEAWNRLAVPVRDAAWRITTDLPDMAAWVREVRSGLGDDETPVLFDRLFALAVTLRSVGRLEVRGRDSAGLVTLVSFQDPAHLRKAMDRGGLSKRLAVPNLVAGAVLSVSTSDPTTLVFVHKVAEEIGRLGQNVTALTTQIREDGEYLSLLNRADVSIQTLAHTRWASNGIINEENCHPVDSRAEGDSSTPSRPVVLAVLNGDIDNFPALQDEFETRGIRIPPAITTDAKIIPMCVELEMAEGASFEDAFRRALSRFEGSFAIAALSTSEPDTLLLAQRGSGQALYVGETPHAFIVASEIYGLVEISDRVIKMEEDLNRDTGEKTGEGRILTLRRDSGSLEAVRAQDFSGRLLDPPRVTRTLITTRDIHRGDFEHFFLKEISDSPESLAKTLSGKFHVGRCKESGEQRPLFQFSDETVPRELLERVKSGEIRHIVCIGQGTASIAGMGIAALFEQVLDRDRFQIAARKASEFSGFGLRHGMEDTLVVAVSQSGTTTDTNRTVDLARKRGASVLAIVNRRNSDLADKADGVLYTSDGRDVEMSVASTKAFYCQVSAGYLLALYLAHATGSLSHEEVARRLEVLGRLPELMRQTLAGRDKIREAAQALALQKRHWAVVGSGLDRVCAEEVRIKLSELNYKSISCDITEDKKHIDLSSEPLILVCAATLPRAHLSDTVKETAIFKAHRACPIVIVQEGETAFDEFAAAVLPVRSGAGELSFLLGTMVGHLWGYYAAGAIDDSATVLRTARAQVVKALPEIRKRSGFALGQAQRLLSRQLGVLGQRFRRRLWDGRFNSALEVETSGRILALFAYVSGRTGLQNSRLDFDLPPRWDAVYDEFLRCLSRGIGELTRPIDAIKHQAKTVTVGISREEVRLGGILFEAVKNLGFSPDDVEYRNLAVIENLSDAVAEVRGTTVYHISGLDDAFRPDENTTLAVASQNGLSTRISSRVASQKRLVGTKLSVLARGRVFIGTGRRDRRPIVIIPTVLRREEDGAVPLLLLHVTFAKDLTVEDKVRILRKYYDRYEEIRWAVGEIIPGFRDEFLSETSIGDLLEEPPELLADRIARQVGEDSDDHESP